MLASGLFDVFATPYAWFYGLTRNYILSISFMAFIVMAITAPLILKSTKGMLEMRQAGARNIAQDEASCVVFGMPKEAIRLGGVEKVVPLMQIPQVVFQMLAQPVIQREQPAN